MNSHIDEYFEDLREDGLLLVDHESRKVGVIANLTGDVVLIAQEDGQRIAVTFDPKEIDSLCAALQQHKRKAIATMNTLEAEYETFTAIQRAIGI
jgi:hypothetical protein